jgi:hypothetical protein
MRFPFRSLLLAAIAATLIMVQAVQGAGKPEDDLAAAIKTFFGKDFAADWQGIEGLPQLRWAPLPPKMLDNCLPDGGCFTRLGAGAIGDRKLAAVATGARTFVLNVYLRNMAAPFGETAVLAALKDAALSADLTRCPVKEGVGGIRWHRLRSEATNPGYLAIQSSCNGKPCETFVLTPGETLPPLQPTQEGIYTENCAAAPVRK